jgi:2-alkyl-3-oxoalkanoate reductase
VGGWVKDEDAPLMNDAPGPFGEALRAVLDLERQVTGAEGMDGLVLRYGFFYGPGTTYAGDGYYAGEMHRRRFPIVGRGEGTFSFIHVEDAASATVAAAERGAPGIYNVADDDPAPMRDWVPVYAEALGAKRPLRVPAFLARLVAGRAAAALATQTRGASNDRAKRELGWSPRYPSWRQGFREALG